MFTLNHGVERVDGGQVGSDADILVSAGRLQVHGDGPVHVAMEVGDHSRREGDVCQATFAVVAEYKGRGTVLNGQRGFSYKCNVRLCQLHKLGRIFVFMQERCRRRTSNML